MTTIRRFCCNDFLRFSSVNLDHLTITGGKRTYFSWLAQWPDYFNVAIAPGNRIMGYISPMGRRNLSLVWSKKLSNLDAENCRIAIKALLVFSSGKQQQHCSKEIPLFLAQNHSPLFISQSAAGYLQHACLKVFFGIAIQPTSEEDKKRCKMSFARGVTFETLMQTNSTTLASEKWFVGLGLKRDQSRRNLYYGRERSHLSTSAPESQTMDFFREYGSLLGSPTSTGQVSWNFEYGGRPVSRKQQLWWNEDKGVVDVFSSYFEAGSGSNGSTRQYFEGGEVSVFGTESGSRVFIPWYILSKYPSLKNDEDGHSHTTLLSHELQQRKVLSVIKEQSYKCYILQGSGCNENSGSERPTTILHILRSAYYPRVVAQSPQSRRDQGDTDVGREKQSLDGGNRNVDIFPFPKLPWTFPAPEPAPAPAPAPEPEPEPEPAAPAPADHEEVASDAEEEW